MRVIILIIFLFVQHASTFGQVVYFVSFKYKRAEGYSLSQPLVFLSSKSLERRANQNIALDSTDLPVSSYYKKKLLPHVGSIVGCSKWLNGVLITIIGKSNC